MDEQDISECKYLSKEAIAFVGPGSINSSGSSGGTKSSGLGRSETGLAHGSMAASLLNSVASSFSGRTSRQPDTLNVTTLLSSNQYTTDGESLSIFVALVSVKYPTAILIVFLFLTSRENIFLLCSSAVVHPLRTVSGLKSTAAVD